MPFCRHGPSLFVGASAFSGRERGGWCRVAAISICFFIDGQDSCVVMESRCFSFCNGQHISFFLLHSRGEGDVHAFAKYVADIGGNAFANEFGKSLLTRPECGENDVALTESVAAGVVGGEDFAHFIFVHRVFCQTPFVASQDLDVNAYRAVSDGACHSLSAVAEIEVDFRVRLQMGLPLRVVGKTEFGNAKILFQCPVQEGEGSGRFLAGIGIFYFPHVCLSPCRESCDEGFHIFCAKGVEAVVDV